MDGAAEKRRLGHFGRAVHPASVLLRAVAGQSAFSKSDGTQVFGYERELANLCLAG